MAKIGYYNTVWVDLTAAPKELRGRCKAHLARLAAAQHGVASGLRIETVDRENGILELKVSWDKQEFRFLFYRNGDIIYVVNFFVKKQPKTPLKEIQTAILRRKEIELDRAEVNHRGFQ